MRLSPLVLLSSVAGLLATRSAAAQAPAEGAAPAPAQMPAQQVPPQMLPQQMPPQMPYQQMPYQQVPPQQVPPQQMPPQQMPPQTPAEVSMQMPSIIPVEAKPRGDAWQATVGVRTMLIRDAGYDPFSTDDSLVQVALSATRVLTRQDRLALAVGADFDYGASDATARGAPSSLALTRLALFAEGRYALHPRLYAFLRAAPGVLNVSASVQDASAPPISGATPASLTEKFTVPSLEGSLGAAACLAPASSPVGAWIVAQAGYGWAPSHALLLSPDVGSADQSKVAPLDLGTLAPRGAFLTFAFAVSY
jgi:hypothetical protein